MSFEVGEAPVEFGAVGLRNWQDASISVFGDAIPERLSQLDSFSDAQALRLFQQCRIHNVILTAGLMGA